jgi:K+-transporting ATPase ATPase C chain
MKTYLLPSLKLSGVLIVICSVIYPLFIAAIGIVAQGSGKGKKEFEHSIAVGYDNVGQKFTYDFYFQGRPSAVEYNAAGSAGSNKGGSNTDYLATVQARIDTFMVHNPGVKKSAIPSDIITASGSGLDPHISLKAANIQVPRIARLRKREEQEIYALIKKCTETPLFGLFGPEKVNVLKLNIELNTL